jgi:hypothetical protein
MEGDQEQEIVDRLGLRTRRMLADLSSLVFHAPIQPI